MSLKTKMHNAVSMIPTRKVPAKEIGVSYSCNIDTVLETHTVLWLS